MLLSMRLVVAILATKNRNKSQRKNPPLWISNSQWLQIQTETTKEVMNRAQFTNQADTENSYLSVYLTQKIRMFTFETIFAFSVTAYAYPLGNETCMKKA